MAADGRAAARTGLSDPALRVAGVMAQASVVDGSTLGKSADQKLESIASHRVGQRPNRLEPRAIKRRPKGHKLLTKPREEARAELRGIAAPAV